MVTLRSFSSCRRKPHILMPCGHDGTIPHLGSEGIFPVLETVHFCQKFAE